MLLAIAVLTLIAVGPSTASADGADPPTWGLWIGEDPAWGSFMDVDVHETGPHAGKIVAVGTSVTPIADHPIFDRSYDFLIARFNPDGTLDPTFGGDGVVTTELHGFSEGISRDEAYLVAVAPDSTVLVAGESSDGMSPCAKPSVVRYLPDGELDAGFGEGGVLRETCDRGREIVDLAVYESGPRTGQFVTAGWGYGIGNSWPVVRRYTADGTRDPDFSSELTAFGGPESRNDYATSVGFTDGGGVVISGKHATSGGNVFAAARLLDDGSLDPGFGDDGIATVAPDPDGPRAIYSVFATVDGSGSIVLAASTAILGDADSERTVLAGLDPNGDADAGFGEGGRVITDLTSSDFSPRDVTAVGDGNLVIAGSGKTTDGRHVAIARFHRDGALDESFGNDGVAHHEVPGCDSSGSGGVAHSSEGPVIAGGAKGEPNAGGPVLLRYGSPFSDGMARCAAPPDPVTDPTVEVRAVRIPGLKSLRRVGVRARVRVSPAARVKLRVRIGPKLARSIGLRRTVIARGAASLDAERPRWVVARPLPRKVARRLRRDSGVKRPRMIAQVRAVGLDQPWKASDRARGRAGR